MNGGSQEKFWEGLANFVLGAITEHDILIKKKKTPAPKTPNFYNDKLVGGVSVVLLGGENWLAGQGCLGHL